MPSACMFTRENPAFYELCDRLGLVVLQDFDLNWTFPTDEEFTRKAVTGFGRMIQRVAEPPQHHLLDRHE